MAPQSPRIGLAAMRMSSLDRHVDTAANLTKHRTVWRLRLTVLWLTLWRRLPALLPALLFVPMVLTPPLNQDVAGVLQFSQRWLAGEHLYTELIDVNPPLIFVLNLIPAGLAAITRLDAVVALQLCLLVYGGFCWWLAMRVRDRRAEGPVERVFLDVLPALVLFGAGYDFGQREHLMAVAAVPYALAAVRRARGEIPRGRILVGLLAGIAFALKPHFLGEPALIELYVLLARRPQGGRMLAALRRGLRDPVPWLMVGVWAVYLASLPLVFPDYIGSVLPLVWNVYLDLGGATVWQVLATQRLGTVVCLLAPLLIVTWRRRAVATDAPLPAILALAAVAALAAAIVQHKGWSYHVLPVQMLACALGGVLAAQWFDRRHVTASAATPYSVAGALAGLFALYAVSNGEAPWRELAYSRDEVASLTDLLEREIAGGRVLVLSPDVYPIYPALNYAGAQSTLRGMSTWLLQGSYPSCLSNGHRYREVGEMSRPEFAVYRSVVEDFARAPPAAVLVDTNTGMPWCGGPFDFIDYFKRDPLFAQTWTRFRMTAELGHYRLYTQDG